MVETNTSGTDKATSAIGSVKLSQLQARRHSRTGSRGIQNLTATEVVISEQPEGVIKKSASRKGLPRAGASNKRDMEKSPNKKKDK